MPASAKPNLNVHFNAPSVRHDAWGRLRSTASAFQTSAPSSAEFRAAKKKIPEILETLAPMERYMGFPGNREFKRLAAQFEDGEYGAFAQAVADTTELLDTGSYRGAVIEKAVGHSAPDVHCFDVLVVKRGGEKNEQLAARLLAWRRPDDPFVYNVVVVESFEDALMATMLNFDIHACVIHDEIDMESSQSLHALEGLKKSLAGRVAAGDDRTGPLLLGDFIHQLRPEVNLFLSTSVSPEKIAGDAKTNFDRIFYSNESSSELHLSIIKAVGARYRTPFFDAVKKYSREPVGTFHALPIARGNSVFNSPWLQDFHKFYGSNIFLAESSATTGGLDSILQPTGTLKQAQEVAAKCYGSKRTYFVTNGTSTANKIVHQGVTKPGDIVLLDRACHESHHFAFLLTGASPYYLESYALNDYSISGAVQLVSIKRALIDLSKKGLLDRVKMVILTNCTFDGLTYNVQHYMEELLAIKPDLVFLWDEAWFAFARFVPHYRQRTAMHSAKTLAEKYRSPAYLKEYQVFKKSFLSKHPNPDEAWAEQKLLPNPEHVKLRAYATQSTHKTLSCFRQGSMIHIYDELFNEAAGDQFAKSYMTHTTTSPNYQVLASLDVSRRQVHLEGYELVQRQIEMAMLIRNAINSHPLVSKYFSALGPSELIPLAYRSSGVKSGFKGASAWEDVARAWEVDDIVLDPSRINVYTARTGISGFILRTKYLAEKHNIQVNKTGLNSFCLMTNVGTTRSAVAYLINVLIEIAGECEERDREFSEAQRNKFAEERERVSKLPPLPDFSGFHASYRLDPAAPAGKMREAFFDGYDSKVVEYFKIDELGGLLDSGREVVGATFIVPVPPGYPMIAPGQTVSRETVTFLEALNPNEILGLDPDLGVRIFKESFFGGSKAVARSKPKAVSRAKSEAKTKRPAKTRVKVATRKTKVAKRGRKAV